MVGGKPDKKKGDAFVSPLNRDLPVASQEVREQGQRCRSCHSGNKALSGDCCVVVGSGLCGGCSGGTGEHLVDFGASLFEWREGGAKEEVVSARAKEENK